MAGQQKMQCGVCTLEIEKSSDDRREVVTLTCGHQFHQACLQAAKEQYIDECPRCLDDNEGSPLKTPPPPSSLDGFDDKSETALETQLAEEQETQLAEEIPLGQPTPPNRNLGEPRKEDDAAEGQTGAATPLSEEPKEPHAEVFGGPKLFAEEPKEAHAEVFGKPKLEGASGGAESAIVATAASSSVDGAIQQLPRAESAIVPATDDTEIGKCHYCYCEYCTKNMKKSEKGGETKFKCKFCAKVDTVWPFMVVWCVSWCILVCAMLMVFRIFWCVLCLWCFAICPGGLHMFWGECVCTNRAY